LRPNHASGSNPLTSAAIRVFIAEASKRVIGPTPERPATTFRQNVSTSFPRGVIAPIPVITTRVISKSLLSMPTPRISSLRTPIPLRWAFMSDSARGAKNDPLGPSGGPRPVRRRPGSSLKAHRRRGLLLKRKHLPSGNVTPSADPAPHARASGSDGRKRQGGSAGHRRAGRSGPSPRSGPTGRRRGARGARSDRPGGR